MVDGGIGHGVYSRRRGNMRLGSDWSFFFFKQKTAYEIVSRDWSSDVCSSDLNREPLEHSVPKQKNIGTTHF